jgi:two-component system OmpR family response regulator
MTAMKILVVDHSELIRFRLTRQLWAMPGIGQVIATAHSLKAQRLLSHMRPALLVLDLDQPHGDPMRLIPQIKHEHPNLRIVALTHDSTDHMRKRCLRAGADGLFNKFIEFEQLLAHVQQLAAFHQLRKAS